MRITNVQGFLLAMGFWATATSAQLLGPTPYTSNTSSPFASLISADVVRLENFEDGLLNVPNVSASAGAPVGPSSITDSVDADDGFAVDGSGTAGWSFFSASGSAGITFTFTPTASGLPTHVGIVWTDGAGTTFFEAFGPGGTPIGTVGPVAIADASISGETGEDRFFGVINAAGVSSIRISNTLGGIEVDHLQFGRAAVAAPPSTAPIPVLGPLALAILAALLGLAGFHGLRRR